MTSSNSTVPVTALPIAQPFIDGILFNTLCYQSCKHCGRAQTLARYACTYCQSPDLQWKDSCGLGTVKAVTEVTRAPTDEFKALAPYTLVIVELKEGFRLMAHAQAGVVIGQHVQSEFFLLGERKLVRFVAQPSV